MQVNIFCIQKSEEFKEFEEKYIKLISNHATLKITNVFNNKIAKAQNLNANEAQKSYEEAFLPHKNCPP